MKNQNNNQWVPDPDAGAKYLRDLSKKKKLMHEEKMYYKLQNKIVLRKSLQDKATKTAYNKLIRELYKKVPKVRIKWIKLQIKAGRTFEQLQRSFFIHEINVALWCLENRR